ncbi:MAG: autotransporter outer membrane beta-barrel domain-containing protein, partial [Pseudomonas sp.]
MEVALRRLGFCRPALALAIGNALVLQALSQTAHAACGPLAAGTYSTSQTCTPAAGVDASISTQPGVIVNTAAGSAILSRGAGANSAISLSGTTVNSTPATNANGVFTQITGAGTGNASILVDGGTNTITQGGSGLNALAIGNANSGTSTVTVTAGTTLNILSTVVGTNRDGIEVDATGGGNIQLQHLGLGTITTLGGNGVWLRTNASGNIEATVGSGVNLVVDNSDPSSAGNTAVVDDTLPDAGASNHAGIYTTASNGNTTVNNAATINAISTNASGILTSGGTGTTSVSNSGAISTNGTNGFGIRSFSTSGSINVLNEGTITTTGEGGHGIYVNDNVGATGNLNIENNATLTVGTATNTAGSRAINVMKRGTGSTTVTGSGDINVFGGLSTLRAYGIIIAAEGPLTVNYSGAINVSGVGAGGIRADSLTDNVVVDYSGARIETYNGNANAIYATTASTTGTVTIRAAGTLITHSDAGGGDGSGIGSFGLQGLSQGGDVSISFTGPLIDVNGSGAAILAGNTFSGGTGLGSLNVSNSGQLLARGNLQRGIRTSSGTGQQTIVNTGAIRTLGASDSQGILAEASGAAQIDVLNQAAVTTQGNNSSAIAALSQGGTVSVTNSAALRGGWGTSAGVALAGLDQSLTNSGSISALSDVAVLGDAVGTTGTLALNNLGQIEGLVTASSSVVTLDNDGTWLLRNFADTDGNGSRDTWAVAVSNLGTGVGNRINNTGLLRLAAQPASGIQTFDASGAFLPLGQTANTPMLGGAVQGQLLGVGTFDNSGTIDLTGGGQAVGNVLLISASQTAGSDGGGVFIANGGNLILNTELNEGDSNSRSDMLVVDSTQTGAGGATRLTVHNIGGQGAQTEGNGIAVINLLNTSAAASASDAFALGSRVVAGPYEYFLYRGAEDGSGTDTWYLRSELDGNPDTPDYRPEASLYGAIPALTLIQSRALIDTLHERMGEERLNRDEPLPSEDRENHGPSLGWGRVIYRSGKQDADRGNSMGSTPQYHYDLTAFQLGMDLYDKLKPDATHDMAGLSVAVSSMDADVRHYTGAKAGNNKIRGYSLGGYWTHFGPEGWYVDTVLQAHAFDVESRPNGLRSLDTNGWGYTVSVEGGYPYEADERLYVEPQTQVIYSHVELDDSHDQGADVRFDDVTSLIGRVGVRLAKEWEDTDREQRIKRTTGWLRPSLWHEFKGQPKTRFSSEAGYIPFDADISGTWGEVNVGLDYQADQKTTFTVSAGYRQSLDGDSRGYD